MTRSDVVRTRGLRRPCYVTASRCVGRGCAGLGAASVHPRLLPTKVNLKRRKILQDSICDICKFEEDTTTHVLWNCEIARETWTCTKVSTPVGVSDGWTFQDILWHMIILDHVEEARVAMVVTVAWVLWCNRNVIRTREKRSRGGRWLIGQQFI